MLKMRLLGLLLIMLLLAGCEGFPNPLAQENVDCSAENTLFSDDFEEGNRCGWMLYNGSGAQVEAEEGVLSLSVSTNGFVAVSHSAEIYENIEISAQTQQISGPNDNAYGLVCRYQDLDNFYIFLISGDGHYAIGKYQTGLSQIEYLTGEAPNHYIFSEYINQGVATNQIRVRCAGTELSLFVNGFLLAEATDDTFTNGYMGVAASTFEPDTVVIEFDNVTAVEP